MMKGFEDVMVETALVTGIELKLLPLLEAQAGDGKKLERTRGEVFEAADGGGEFAAKQFFDRVRREPAVIGGLDLLPFDDEWLER